MKRDDLSGCALFCFLIIGAAGVMVAGASVGFFSTFLPLWGAVLVGLPVGVVVFLLSIVSETTLMERAIRCLIWVVLIWILIPVFDRARQNAKRVKMQQQIRQRPVQQQPEPTGIRAKRVPSL